jgi:hypothetical protein
VKIDKACEFRNEEDAKNWIRIIKSCGDPAEFSIVHLTVTYEY